MNNFIRKHPVDISRYLPQYLSKDEIYNNLLKVISADQEKVRQKLQLLLEQMFVITADDCLEDWEIFLGIPIDHSQLARDRRQRILNKIQGAKPATVDFLSNVVNQYVADKQAVIEEHNDDYYIDILYHGGQIFDYDNLRKSINTYIPAHIGYKLVTITTGSLEVHAAGTVQCALKNILDMSTEYQITVDESGLNVAGAVIHNYKYSSISGGK